MRTRIAAVVMALVAGCAASSTAQDAARDHARMQEKAARAAIVAAQRPLVRQLLPPGQSTASRPYLRIEVHQGGVYNPSLFTAESWLEIACIHDDLQTDYRQSRHGSGLFEIHAIVYDDDLDEIHNTLDTAAIDEAICDVEYTVDTSFIELSRSDGRRAASVALIALPSAGQYIEASKLVYRILPE